MATTSFASNFGPNVVYFVVVNVNENVNVNVDVNVNATYRCVPKVGLGAKYFGVVIIGFEGAKIF